MSFKEVEKALKRTSVPKPEFTKVQIKRANNLSFEFEKKLKELNQLGYEISNNPYIIRNGVKLRSSFQSQTLKNGSTKVIMLVVATMPKRD